MITEVDCLNIAIIGGGASGTLCATQLLQRLNTKAKIFLIEKKRESVFRGAAYSSQLAYEPLNVVAGRMSIYNHLPDDFYNWLKQNKQQETTEVITPESYVSRRWFGDYMAEKLNFASENSHVVDLQVLNKEVVDVEYNFETDCYKVVFSELDSINADYLIFATGNEAPANVLDSNQALALGTKYIQNPWLGDSIKNIGTEDDVLIIGTGLTMVDHVASLKKQNHRGKIFCFSRNGYLPREHAPIQHITLDIDIPENVREMYWLLKQKFEAAQIHNEAWQNVLDAFRPYTSACWRNLTKDDKQYFLKRLKIFWEIHRHRMPSASAQILRELIDAGQLDVIAGEISSAVLVDGRVEFKYISKQSGLIDTKQVDFIINCTGPSGDYYKCENQLFKNLLSKGWMQQDELKLGIRTGARGEILKSNGVVLHNAFAVGPLRKATDWESTAIREIRTHAENIAIAIALPAEKSYDMAVESGL